MLYNIFQWLLDINAGDMGSVSGLGRSSGGGNSNPLQYSCLDNPTDRGAWGAGRGNNAITNLIREDKIVMIPGAIQSGHKEGMHTLNEDLVGLFRDGKISKKTATLATYDVQDLEKQLGNSNAFAF